MALPPSALFVCAEKAWIGPVDAGLVEAAHAVVELRSEGYEREGEGCAARFAEAEAEVEEWLEAELGEHVLVCWFCR